MEEIACIVWVELVGVVLADSVKENPEASKGGKGVEAKDPGLHDIIIRCV